LLASKADALAQRFDRLGTPSGSQVGSSSGAMFEIGALCEMCGLQGHVVAECHSMFQGVSMPMLCKTSTLAHKTTPTRTHTTLIGETTLTCPIEKTTPFLLMPLNLSLLVSNIEPHIIHLLNNSLLRLSPI